MSAFNLERVLRTGYYIDVFQATYFVIDRFEGLFDLLRGPDLTTRFDELRALPAHTPFEPTIALSPFSAYFSWVTFCRADGVPE